MKHTALVISSITIALCLNSGCITGGPPSTADTVLSDGIRPDQPLDPAAALTQPSQLVAGQLVEVWRAGGPRGTADQSSPGPSPTAPVQRYSGTVVRATAGEIELQPAALLVHVAEVSAVPVLSRIPFVNRAFRQHRMTDQLQPLDTSIIVPHNEIIAIYDLSQVSTERLQSLQPYERIGVDFDMSAQPVN
ncbi:MAG: hypothetical protein ACKO3T_21685 [Planctomycetaceae bacterium]